MSSITIDDACIEEIARRISKYTVKTWLSSREAADYLSCAEGTLKTWRSRGCGPRYNVLMSKMVRYHVDDLDAFVRAEASL